MAKKLFETIKIGAQGKEVCDCQKALHLAGSTIKITGKFGIGMMSAVKAFQKKNNLKVTGEIDSKTMTKLNEYLAPKAKKTTSKK